MDKIPRSIQGRRSNIGFYCYWWSMDENDEHILEEIPRDVIDTIGVSVYKGGKSDLEFQMECEKWDNKLKEKFPEAKERLLVESTLEQLIKLLQKQVSVSSVNRYMNMRGF